MKHHGPSYSARLGIRRPKRTAAQTAPREVELLGRTTEYNAFLEFALHLLLAVGDKVTVPEPGWPVDRRARLYEQDNRDGTRTYWARIMPFIAPDVAHEPSADSFVRVFLDDSAEFTTWHRAGPAGIWTKTGVKGHGPARTWAELLARAAVDGGRIELLPPGITISVAEDVPDDSSPRPT